VARLNTTSKIALTPDDRNAKGGHHRLPKATRVTGLSNNSQIASKAIIRNQSAELHRPHRSQAILRLERN
jgi:hypothetical protein